MRRTAWPPARDRRGMTLLEVLVAVSILAVIVVALVASLRVGLRAWEVGEARAAAQQEVRALVELVSDALAMAYPYRGRLGDGLGRVVLFEGEAEEVRFVTAAAPLVLEAPAAPFHAVRLGYTAEDRLAVVERLLPAEPAGEPFAERPRTVLSRAVTGLRLEYLDETGAWLERWDGREAKAIPAAVRVELRVREREQERTLPAFVVPLALGKGPA